AQAISYQYNGESLRDARWARPAGKRVRRLKACPTVCYCGLSPMPTNADRIICMMQQAGISRLFGMPGGGSPADLIAAAGRAGFPFTLAHAETAGAFMAAAQAEITGRPGACVATLGPGAASLLNGVSHAFLDRVALLAITDHHSTPGPEHQTLPHSEMFAPVVKWTGRDIDRAFEHLVTSPPGAVHLYLSAALAGAPAGAEWTAVPR